jgi:DNA-binding NarL/FixJ family response regulator
VLIYAMPKLLVDILDSVFADDAEVTLLHPPADVDSVVDAVSLTKPDVVIVGEQQAGPSPAQKVAVLGVREQEADVIAWAEAGAAGYVSREGSGDDLRAALEAAAAGETVASPRMVAALLRRLNAVAHGGAAHGLDAAATLTPREQQVARLVSEGLSNKEIAAQLCIEVATVKNHVHNILQKLDVPGRGQAAAYLRAGR